MVGISRICRGEEQKSRREEEKSTARRGGQERRKSPSGLVANENHCPVKDSMYRYSKVWDSLNQDRVSKVPQGR